MTPELMTGIIIAFLGVVGGTGFWQYWTSRKKAPIEQKDADIAHAEKSQQMAMAIADDLREDYVRLRADLGSEREERQKLSGRVDGLETHIREQARTIGTLRDAVRIFSAAWDDLELRWHEYRLSDKPKQRPHVQTD